MRRWLLTFLAVISLSGAAFGQTPLGPTTLAGSTIAVTNTFQQVLAQATTPRRNGCQIQNNGSHAMYVFYGPIANATTSNSFIINPSQSVSCQNSNQVVQDQVSITGTAGDAYVVASQ